MCGSHEVAGICKTIDVLLQQTVKAACQYVHSSSNLYPICLL